MLFKVVASKAGKIVFDGPVEAPDPRAARTAMKQALQLDSLSGLVYTMTEVPVALIVAIVDARLANPKKKPADLIALCFPFADRPAIDGTLRRDDSEIPVGSRQAARFDAFAQSAPGRAAAAGARLRRKPRPHPSGVDWAEVRAAYKLSRSIKQTAARFHLSPNTVKARARREGWAS